MKSAQDPGRTILCSPFWRRLQNWSFPRYSSKELEAWTCWRRPQCSADCHWCLGVSYWSRWSLENEMAKEMISMHLRVKLIL